MRKFQFSPDLEPKVGCTPENHNNAYIRRKCGMDNKEPGVAKYILFFYT